MEGAHVAQRTPWGSPCGGGFPVATGQISGCAVSADQYRRETSNCRNIIKHDYTDYYNLLQTPADTYRHLQKLQSFTFSCNLIQRLTSLTAGYGSLRPTTAHYWQRTTAHYSTLQHITAHYSWPNNLTPFRCPANHYARAWLE